MARQGLKRGIIGIAAIGAMLATAPVSAGAPRRAVIGDTDAQASRELCQTIIRSVSALPPGSSKIDLESAVVFAISQAPALQGGRDKRQIGRIVSVALNCAAGLGTHRHLAAALGNVRFAYGIGTAAVRGGSAADGGMFGGGFSQPLVGIGGGSSNYSTR